MIYRDDYDQEREDRALARLWADMHDEPQPEPTGVGLAVLLLAAGCLVLAVVMLLTA